MKYQLALIHIFWTAIVAFISLALIFSWYPGPFLELTGGQKLAITIIGALFLGGPLLTLIISIKEKPKKNQDQALILGLQAILFAIGMHALYVGRPVFLVYNAHQFNVVLYKNLNNEDKKTIPEGIEINPLHGPITIGAVAPKDATTQSKDIISALMGRDIYLNTKYYTKYDIVKAEAMQSSKSPNEFIKTNQINKNLLEKYPKNSKFIPVVLNNKYVIAILNDKGYIEDFAPEVLH